jgi:heme exporter protein A
MLEPVIGSASGKTRVVVTHDVAGGLSEADVTLGLRDGAGVAVGDEVAVRELYG